MYLPTRLLCVVLTSYSIVCVGLLYGERVLSQGRAYAWAGNGRKAVSAIHILLSRLTYQLFHEHSPCTLAAVCTLGTAN